MTLCSTLLTQPVILACVISSESHRSFLPRRAPNLREAKWERGATATAVTELFLSFPGRLIVPFVRVEPATYCVLVPRSAESLSPAIIPNKTSVVIPAMFHHGVAGYSEAHCRRTLARTKIITRECLCVCLQE